MYITNLCCIHMNVQRKIFPIRRTDKFNYFKNSIKKVPRKHGECILCNENPKSFQNSKEGLNPSLLELTSFK